MSCFNFFKKYDYIIVGAGLSGSVIAERIANVLKRRVLVVDKRDHIGGNCYDYVDDETGILMNAYGAHIFHTNHEDVWEYINKFAKWQRWDHRVIAKVDGKNIPLPININTINSLFDENLHNEDDMKRWLSTKVVECDEIKNSEEFALSRVGDDIYEKIFKHYTFKQWNKYPSELDASVLSRIPLRYNFDDRYFNDKYQALPVKGYTEFFKRLLDHKFIDVKLNTDFKDVRVSPGVKVVYTGPIDQYFSGMGLPKLEYRSIRFIAHKFDFPYFQNNSVINYPGADVSYTRIVEYKHFLNQKSPKTIVVKEVTTDEGEPYYPVPSDKNKELYEKYQSMACKEKNVYFVGRLATYKYLNMDEAIKQALDLFENEIAK
jgi:UDP-galactopyranose mutase